MQHSVGLIQHSHGARRPGREEHLSPQKKHKKLSCCCDSRSYCMQQYDRLKTQYCVISLLTLFNMPVQLLALCTNSESHRQTHGQTDRRTDRRQDYANSRSYCVAVRSAKWWPEKKRPEFFPHNFNKCRHSFVIFGINHPEDSFY